MSYDVKWIGAIAGAVIVIVAFVAAATIKEYSLNDCRSSGFDAGHSVEEINEVCR
jgi:hypothetical protein